ncbi:hypothetical protein [Sinorhizobium chiapasense]|uniref:Uncharacterized protein n=1 Tax=Sinorhizobium chiapasense TaxID=501572 RepID=A0ABZ2BK66_9HYPH
MLKINPKSLRTRSGNPLRIRHAAANETLCAVVVHGMADATTPVVTNVAVSSRPSAMGGSASLPAAN